jgi:hypothetical protein
MPAPPPAGRSARPRVLNESTSANLPLVPLQTLVVCILTLAQALCEKKYYPYQVQFAYRLIESILLRDGETVTALLARQSGKTDAIASVVAAILVIVPWLAKKYPNDWRLNLTDDDGRDRGYSRGIRIGIYAPRMDQAQIMFERVRLYLATKTARQVLLELRYTIDVSNGNTIKISNGSRSICESASEQSKIEGETHDLLIIEEAQDVSDIKVKKSLHPMVSSRNGTIVKIGTATSQRCDFYDSIKTNERTELAGGKQNHFFYPYTICERYNSLYRVYIEKEKVRIGEDSDEFQMSYGCRWLFERGMFITQEQLFHKDIALCHTDLFSNLYPFGLPTLPQYSIVAGIDWGKMYDSTVLTLMAVDWNEPLESFIFKDAKVGETEVTLYKSHIINWEEWQGDNYEIQFHEICNKLLSLGSHLKRVVMDANTAGQPLFDRMESVFADRGVDMVPFNFHEKQKSDAYKSLYGAFCGKRITFPAAPAVRKFSAYRKFVHQMLELRKTYKKALMSVSHPDEKNAHDDYPDSLVLAHWGTLMPTTDAELTFSDSNFLLR